MSTIDCTETSSLYSDVRGGLTFVQHARVKEHDGNRSQRQLVACPDDGIN